jgi:hypothetical protein
MAGGAGVAHTLRVQGKEIHILGNQNATRTVAVSAHDRRTQEPCTRYGCHVKACMSKGICQRAASPSRGKVMPTDESRVKPGGAWMLTAFAAAIVGLEYSLASRWQRHRRRVDRRSAPRPPESVAVSTGASWTFRSKMTEGVTALVSARSRCRSRSSVTHTRSSDSARFRISSSGAERRPTSLA